MPTVNPRPHANCWVCQQWSDTQKLHSTLCHVISIPTSTNLLDSDSSRVSAIDVHLHCGVIFVQKAARHSLLNFLTVCTRAPRGWGAEVGRSCPQVKKNLKSLRSSHQNNVQSSLGTPCARSFIKSCIWVFAQAWTSECADDHQPFRKVLQKVVRSAQNAFNISHCKQWRQGRQQEQQVGRKCLIQHIHNWSITPFAIFCQRSGRVRRLPAIQLRPATVSCPPCAWESFKHSRCLSSMLQAEVSEVCLIVFQQVPDITTLCNREVPCSTQPKKKAYSRIQLSV